MGILSRFFSPTVAASATSDLTSPRGWLVDAFGGRLTASGERVTDTGALALPAFAAATRIVPGDVAKVSYRYKVKKGRGLAIASGPLDTVLHDRWNPVMSAFDGWRVTVQRSMVYGNFYAEIIRDPQGNVRELWPIHPYHITPKLGDDGRTVTYEWRVAGMPSKTLESRDVFHVKNMGDGVEGHSVIRYAAESLGLGLAAQKASADFYGSGMRKQLIATSKLPLNAPGIEAIQKIIKHGQNNETGDRKVPFIPGDVTLTDAGIAPDDAQFIESLEFFGVADVSRITGCPLWLLSSDKRAQGWSTFDMQYQAYIDGTLVHHTKAIDGETRLKLIPAREAETHESAHNFDTLMRADPNVRAEYLTKMRRLGAYSANDVKTINNENPIEEDWADQYHVSADLVLAESLGDEPDDDPEPPVPPPQFPEPEPDEPEEDEDDPEEQARLFGQHAGTLAAGFSDAARRFVSKREAMIARATKRHAGNATAWDAWAEKFRARQLSEAYAAFDPGRLMILGLAGAHGIEDRGEATVSALNGWANEYAAATITAESEDPAALAEDVRARLTAAVLE